MSSNIVPRASTLTLWKNLKILVPVWLCACVQFREQPLWLILAHLPILPKVPDSWCWPKESFSPAKNEVACHRIYLGPLSGNDENHPVLNGDYFTIVTRSIVPLLLILEIRPLKWIIFFMAIWSTFISNAYSKKKNWSRDIDWEAFRGNDC